MDEVLPTGHHSRGGAAQELVPAVDDDVGAFLREPTQVILRRRIDDHQHVTRMRDFHYALQRHHAVLDRMMRDDVHDAGRPFADHRLDLEVMRPADGTYEDGLASW